MKKLLFPFISLFFLLILSFPSHAHTTGIMQVVPDWLRNAVVALGALVLVAGTFILLLRKRVSRATEDIRQRERRLRESETNYRVLADSGQALIWTARPDKLCDYFNKVWLDFTGRTFEQEFGNGWTEGVHPDDLERCVGTYVTAFDKREPFSMDYRLRRHDGEYRWLQDDGCPRYDMNGNFAGYIGYCLDVTERKLVEKTLQEKNNELEGFTYTVSHDLKSPLITIQSFAGQIIHDFQANNFERIPDDLKRICAAATKMTALLDDLLELSRIGRMLNQIAPIDMNLLVKDVLAQLAGPLQQRQIEIVVQPDLPIVCGDRQRIAMLLQNLVENSIKYMGNQVAPRIEIIARPDGTETVFCISDNGMGINPRYHENIFGLFNKLDTKSEGTGVGLALVKRIIEMHNGRIWVESEGEGQGACFCFTI